MVYLVDGTVFEGHRPKTGDAYERSPSVFSQLDVPTARKHFAAVKPGAPLHLYVSAACPWAHRASLARALLGLEERVLLSVVEPRRDDSVGWEFKTTPAEEAKTQDEEAGETLVPTADQRGTGFKYLYQVYLAARPDYTGNVTTPLLTTADGAIISNESWDIARALVVLVGDDNHPYYPTADAGRCGDIDALAK